MESTESDYIKRRGCIELKSSEDLNDHDQSASPPFKGNTGKLAMIKGMSTILSGMKPIGDADYAKVCHSDIRRSKSFCHSPDEKKIIRLDNGI